MNNESSHIGVSAAASSGLLTRRAFIGASALAACGALGMLAGCGADDTQPSGGQSSTAASQSPAGGTKGADDLGLVEAGKLTVGSDCDYPPFISMDGEHPQGFEYELLLAVAQKMGLELSFLAPQKFDTLVPSIVSGGKMDLAVSSITITDERKEQVDFCDAYFDSNLSLSVVDGSGIQSSDDLAGATVGAQSGTTGESWVKENLEAATLIPFDDQSSAFVALQAGKVEAICIDLPVAVDMIANAYPDCVILEEIPTGEQYAFAVSKENAALREAVNKALQEVRDDGTYDELYDAYFTV